VNANRRAELAEVARRHVPTVSDAVVASWGDLLPASEGWRAEARQRAVAASHAAVAALPTIIRQGDLDDQSWHGLRQLVLPHGHLIASELLRAVVIAGVERLADHLAAEAGLTHDERWQLQQEASTFSETLLLERSEPDPAAYDQLLTDLKHSGPDLG
jgi:hypothetical protein